MASKKKQKKTTSKNKTASATASKAKSGSASAIAVNKVGNSLASNTLNAAKTLATGVTPSGDLSLAKPRGPSAYTPGKYFSAYGDRIDKALNSIIDFKYDPLQDASYQALAKVYGARGNLAAKDTLADAASLNGGMQTSYAVSAAQQARNQYNQELAAMIPELEQNAFNRAQVTYNALRDADDTAYGRFRDTEGDRQWMWSNQYNAYRDQMSDYQFGLNYNYQKGRDAVEDKWRKKEFSYQKQRDKVADQQWAKEYALSKKGSSGSSGGGGGRRRSSGGGSGGYSKSSTSSSSSMPITKEEYNNILNQNKKKKTKATSGAGGGNSQRINKNVIMTK